MNSTRNVNLKEKDIRFLCESVIELFKEEPILLEIDAPVNICGRVIITQVIFMANTMTF
jgi:hypothetical protein